MERAVITHVHSDHARWGMKHYLAHQDSAEVMKLRLGADISLHTLDYQEKLEVNGVKISLHPAGHIPGSAQVRLEYQGKVAVVSGDYKVENDLLATPFEPVNCHEFVSECTFGLPIYKWESQAEIFSQINSWWKENASEGRNSVLFAYSLGKAQRIIQNLNREIGEVFVHGAIWNTNQALIANGIHLWDVPKVTQDIPKNRFKGALIIAPPSAMGTPWMRRFSPYRTGICSGWMAVRGTRRRRAADRGFVLSDHADWHQLIQSVKETGARKIFLTSSGYSSAFSRWLEENGYDVTEVETKFTGEIKEIEETLGVGVDSF